MRTANAILPSLDGRENRSRAWVHSLEPLIKELFAAARGPLNYRIVDPATIDFNALGHFSDDGRGFDTLRQRSPPPPQGAGSST